jgi:hypothetical protein
MHDLTSLQQGTQDDKYCHQNRRPPEGKQAATHRRADTVGSIVGAYIPADIGTGSKQDENYRFDVGLTSMFFVSAPNVGDVEIVRSRDRPISKPRFFIKDIR